MKTSPSISLSLLLTLLHSKDSWWCSAKFARGFFYVMINISGIKFRQYQFTDDLYFDLLYGYGLYILCDKKFKPLYVGMSINNVGRRIYMHQRKGWKIGFVLISEIDCISLKDYVKKTIFDEEDDFDINEYGLCFLINNGHKAANRQYLLEKEKRLIKQLNPIYNIEHNRHGRK